VVQPKCLESGGKSMEKMKSKDSETDKVDVIIYRNFEKTMSYGIKIFRVPLHKSKLDEIKIKKMKDEKCQY
jgi:hypothetical protein